MQKLLKFGFVVIVLLGTLCFILVLVYMEKTRLLAQGVKLLKTPWLNPVAMETATNGDAKFIGQITIFTRAKTTPPTTALAENTVDRQPSLNKTRSTFNRIITLTQSPKAFGDGNVSYDVSDNKTDDVNNNKNKTRKYLIYVCDRKRSCGGWGDRQRGLIGMFVLALVTGRRFGINMSVPCDVTHFYIPSGHVDWIIPDSEVAGKTSTWLDDMQSRLHLTIRLSSMDFNKEFPQDVVFIRTNAGYARGISKNKLYNPLLSQLIAGYRGGLSHFAWEQLMTPTPRLQSHVDKIMDSMSFKSRKQPLVCAHVRVGRSETFKKDNTIRFNMTHLPILWDFVAKWVNNGSRLFLATDSLAVRNRTRQHFGKSMIDADGPITHVDLHKNSCIGFESTLVDQLILTLCDVLILTRSNLGSYSLVMRESPAKMFRFRKGKIE